ncbi:MAG: sigma-70 family RNA polymerase sigma factor [Chloroflexaceae bacterium]|nr:sigma-70 family RNA polymerase sigma factor [Chloroflexaceae bacterium]
MEQDAYHRCVVLIAHLNNQEQWNLTPEEQVAYCTALAPLVSAQATDTALRHQIIFYHTHHTEVAILRHPQHPQYDAAWKIVQAYLLQVLLRRVAGYPDAYGMAEEIRQDVLEQLKKSLPTYRYQSQLKTWLQGVAQQRANRHLGRKLPPPAESLEAQIAQGVAVADTGESPSEVADAAALQALISQILTNARQHQAFRLASQGYTLAEIGAQIGWSIAWTSIQIKRARELLQRHPEIRAWLHDEDAAPGE